MSSLDYVKVHDVVDGHHVFFFEDSNVAVDVQVFQVLLPLLESYDSDDRLKHVLQRLVSTVLSATDDDLVELGKHLVLLEHH